MANINLTGFEFFNIILPGISEKRLRLPDKFARELDGRELRDAKLQVVGAGPRLWEVELVEDEHNGKVYLCRGWQRFARAHDIQVGHFLVFRFDGASVFTVTVFDPSMCRRRYQQDAGGASAAPFPRGGGGGGPAMCVEAPSQFTATLRPSNLLEMQKQYLNVPVWFQDAHRYASRKKVVLEMGGDSWTVNLKRGRRPRGSGSRTTFKYGWRRFCVDNGLGLGDTCFFRALREGDGGEHVLEVKVRKPDGTFLE